MKRDMDLVRSILMIVEEHEHGFAPQGIEVNGYSREEIEYHAYLMLEAGLIDGSDVTSMADKSPAALISGLSWAGHEFLDSAREPSRWQQAKEMIGKFGGAPIAVWTAVLVDLVKKNLGI